MRFVIMFPLSILSLFLSAQTAAVSFTPDFEFRQEGEIVKMGKFYYRSERVNFPIKYRNHTKLRETLHGITLHKYDQQMKELKTVSWSDGERIYGPVMPYFFKFGAKLMMLYYSYPFPDTIKVFLAEVDPETLLPGKSQEIFAYGQKGDKASDADHLGVFDRIRPSFSPDEKKLLLSIKFADDAENIPFRIVEDDLRMTELLQIPVPEDLVTFSIFLMMVANDGTVLCTVNYTEERQKKTGIIIRRIDGSSDFMFFDTGTFDKVPGYLAINFSEDSRTAILFSSYHGVVSSPHLCQGFITAKLDLTSFTLSNVRLTPYTEDILRQMDKLGHGVPDGQKIYARNVGTNFTGFADGSFILTGFPSYKNTMFTTKRRNETVTVDRAGPVVIVAVSADTSSIQILPRNIHDIEVSHIITWKNEEEGVYCIYADAEENSKNDLGANPGFQLDVNKYVLMLAKISKNGHIISRERISDLAPDKGTFFVRKVQQTGPRSFVFPSGKYHISTQIDYTEINHMVTVEIK